MVVNDPKGYDMTNEPNENEGVTEGKYNPSGGVPNHPADPGYEGDTDTEDDDTTEDDES